MPGLGSNTKGVVAKMSDDFPFTGTNSQGIVFSSGSRTIESFAES
jgi:hypothetical protein